MYSKNIFLFLIKSFFIAAFLFFCLKIDTSHADTLHVELPQLQGFFGVNRSIEFDLGVIIESINNVKVKWNGTITPGLGHGDGVEKPEYEWFEWPTQIYAYLKSDENAYWSAYTDTNRTFNDTTRFERHFNASWDFLLDGQGEIQVGLAPFIILGGTIVIPPSAYINNIELIVEAVVSETAVLEDHSQATVPYSPVVFQNFPNPFNLSTKIRFFLSSSVFVSLKIFNFVGECVETLVDQNMEEGMYEIDWNTKGLSSGIYLCRLETDNSIELKRMILIK